jgi:hypothetical protein
MFAACAFWMMKITATTRTAKPAISPVRIPLVQVRGCPRPGGGVAGGGGVEPLAEGGGSVLVVPCGAAGSVMALLPSKWDRLAQAVAGPLRARSRGRRAGLAPAQEQDGKHDDHDDHDCSEADEHLVLLWCLGLKKGVPDPAERGGRGWMAGPGPRC